MAQDSIYYNLKHFKIAFSYTNVTITIFVADISLAYNALPVELLQRISTRRLIR